MYRLWIKLTKVKNDAIEITSTENTIIYNGIINILIPVGRYSTQQLADYFITENLDVRLGEIKDSKNTKCLVLYTTNSSVTIGGSFINSHCIIESLDNGDRTGNIIVYN